MLYDPGEYSCYLFVAGNVSVVVFLRVPDCSPVAAKLLDMQWHRPCVASSFCADKSEFISCAGSFRVCCWSIAGQNEQSK